MIMEFSDSFAYDFYENKAPRFCRDFDKKLEEEVEEEEEKEENDLKQQEVIDPAMNIHYIDHYLLSSEVNSPAH